MIDDSLLEKALDRCQALSGPEGDGTIYGGMALVIEELLDVRSPENAPQQVQMLCEEALQIEDGDVKQWFLVRVFEVAGGDIRDLPSEIMNLGRPPRQEKERVVDAKVESPFSPLNAFRRPGP